MKKSLSNYLVLSMVFFLIQTIAACSPSKTVPLQVTKVAAPTMEPTTTLEPSPTLAATQTLTPTITPSPTPTKIYIPENLNSDFFYEFVTIDPYKFYIEEKGYIKAFLLPNYGGYETLDREDGDNIEGNEKTGWYITRQNQVVYFGPGIVSDEGILFELWSGEKDLEGNVNIIEKKYYLSPKNTLVTVRLGDTNWPGPPLFLYFPTTSSFIIQKRSNESQNFSIYPKCAFCVNMLVTSKSQILLKSDYESYPKWCVSGDLRSICGTGNSTTGILVDGVPVYTGAFPDGEVNCPIIKEAKIEE